MANCATGRLTQQSRSDLRQPIVRVVSGGGLGAAGAGGGTGAHFSILCVSEHG